MRYALFICSLLLSTLSAGSVSAQNCRPYDVYPPQFTTEQITAHKLLANAFDDAPLDATTNKTANKQAKHFASCTTPTQHTSSKQADDPLHTVTRERWEDATQAWRPDESTVFTYDDQDRLLEVVKDRWSPGNQIWVPVSINNYIYSGTTREIITTIWNGTTHINDRREILARDTVANAVTVRSEEWIANAWQVQSVTTSFNDGDLLQEAQTTQFQGGLPLVSSRITASYDDLDRVTRWLFEQFNDISSQWDTTGQQLFTYTDSSAVLLAQAYLDVNQWDTFFRLTSLFNDRGLVSNQTREFLQPFPSISRTLFEYEAGHDNPISIINQFIDLQGNWANDVADFITHDSDGDILIRLNQLYSQPPGSAGAWLNVRQDIFLYDRVSTSVETTSPALFSVAIYPNPANRPVTIAVSIADAAVVEIIAFDILGREVATLQRKTVTTGTNQLVWDTAALPAGQYFVRVRSKDKVKTYPVTLLP